MRQEMSSKNEKRVKMKKNEQRITKEKMRHHQEVWENEMMNVNDTRGLFKTKYNDY